MHCIKIHLDVVQHIEHITHPDGSRVADEFTEKIVPIPFVDESEMEAAFEHMMCKLEDGAKFLNIRGMGIATANIVLVEMVRHVEA